jgi:hypothetical protein
MSNDIDINANIVYNALQKHGACSTPMSFRIAAGVIGMLHQRSCAFVCFVHESDSFSSSKLLRKNRWVDST